MPNIYLTTTVKHSEIRRPPQYPPLFLGRSREYHTAPGDIEEARQVAKIHSEHPLEHSSNRDDPVGAFAAAGLG